MSDQPPSPRSSPRRVTAALLVIVSMFPIVQLAVAPALSDIGERLDRTPSQTVWVMSTFLLASSVFAPVLGCLGDLFGHRRVLAIAVMISAAGSLIGFAGHDLWQVIVGRTLQGAIAGIFPLTFSLARQLLPDNVHAEVVGLLTAMAGVAAGIAMLLGGVLTDLFSFRAVFLVQLLGSAGVLVVVGALPGVRTRRTETRLDLTGTVLLAVGIFLLMYAVTEIGTWVDNPLRAIALLGGASAFFGLLVWQERRTDSPLLNLSMLGQRPVLLINVATLFVNLAGFVVFVIVPQFAQIETVNGYGFGSSATLVGALLLPPALLTMAAGPLFGRMGERIGHHRTLALAAGTVAVGMAGLAGSLSAPVPFFISAGLGLVGLNLAFTSMTNGIIGQVPTHRLGEATGTNSLVRTIGNALGAQLAAGILATFLVQGSLVPQRAGFVVAFAVCATFGLASAAVSLAVPPKATGAM